MKPSIIGRFLAAKEQYPLHSDYLCFGKAVEGLGLTRRTLIYYFKRLVPADDYPLEYTPEKDEKLDIFEEHVLHFASLSNTPSVTAPKI